MKDYNVKQISELLNTNPETVRRWIRSGKLAASQHSKKGGNIISEEALMQFLRATPKYAGLAAILAAAAVPSLSTPAVMSAFLGSVITGLYKTYRRQITPDQIKQYLQRRTAESKKTIREKQKQIRKLQEEIRSEQVHLDQYTYALENFDLEDMAEELNRERRAGEKITESKRKRKNEEKD